MIIQWLSNKFSFKVKYTEKEINNIINEHDIFGDIPLLRREFVSQKYLDRKDDGSIYCRIH